MNYKKQYNQQKASAKYRNIDWQFTYDTWIEWWGDDIVYRGKTANSLCMSRKDDIGPYHPENCFKSTLKQNTSSAHLGKSKGKQPRELVERRAKIYKGRPNPKVAIALTGRKLSNEHKDNIRKSLQLFHAIKKELV